ncbi:MAG TPA: BadF/BadG/BcrA/BcrD ATPase family protein [Thermoanaerobaculia bacterium]|nr:BadF/BadG/BcrA/BcrD ATPase family protein [Thermoanaerobaculia bacterium]
MTYVLGIDAGGTRATALLADLEGAVVREARAGGANLRVHGREGIARVLRELLAELAAPGPIVATAIGMAGVDRPEEKERVERLLRELGIAGPVRVGNDAAIALHAGTPDGIGIVVISGTGSIAYGCDPSGTTARSGGWGYLLGDEGSGFWLGQSAVRSALRSAEGRGPTTSLYEQICGRLGLDTPASLLEWFYEPERSRRRVAELALLVEEAASDGDRVAGDLLDEAAEHLGQAARAVARKLSFPGPYPLVLAGGAFRICPSLAERFERVVDLAAARVVRLAGEPALGAVRLALGLLAGSAAPR